MIIFKSLIVLLILKVCLVQKEEDMKKNLYSSVDDDDDDYGGLDSFFGITDDNQDMSMAQFFSSIYKKTSKYACYVNHAINNNFECSMQCLKYLSECEQFF